jgi:hypothetical protein
MLINKEQSFDQLNSRLADSFQHSVRLEKPWGWVDQSVAWCKEEITGEWRWQIVRVSGDQSPGEYIFYFDSDRDLCAFVMKWS